MIQLLSLIVLVYLADAQEVITDPAEANITLTRCNELNIHRVELAKCCNYPHINLHRLLIDNCVDECIGSADICCPMGCLWRLTKIVHEGATVDLKGLKKTLKRSIFFDTEWMELIDTAIDECNDEVKFNGVDPHCQFPSHLPKLLGCTIKKLFLQCPRMNDLQGACEITKEYVKECM